MLERTTSESNLLESVITCDKRHGILPMTQKVSARLKSPGFPRPNKARLSKSKLKSMLTVFFDIIGIVMIEWVTSGQTRKVVKRLREKIWKKKRTQSWRDG
ncbi:hypothetical protein TNIN_87181 [Trichonephila inaurata madagascariensis]|uniref:Uncharacterized protein n=1 Tax=Trichonephila inaurata madagascariensis TaxID=2747483 RepID=A0A8X6MBE5_9ARAC|nr:hypothetical protein TNIN_133711 [Trichonephila inaurata madagascariensis]GFY78705.1 hypothetical protein TNIN_87181 [Trichonephila inaurata madagascariensis]